MSHYGSNCDVIGAPYILSENHCKKAAEALQLQWKLWTNWNVHPRGCYETNSGNVFFNRIEDGRTNNETRNICKKSIHVISLFLIHR